MTDSKVQLDTQFDKLDRKAKIEELTTKFDDTKVQLDTQFNDFDSKVEELKAQIGELMDKLDDFDSQPEGQGQSVDFMDLINLVIQNKELQDQLDHIGVKNELDYIKAQRELDEIRVDDSDMSLLMSFLHKEFPLIFSDETGTLLQ